jgi:hypothetical protein
MDELTYRTNAQEILTKLEAASAAKDLASMKMYVQQGEALYLKWRPEFMQRVSETVDILEEIHSHIKTARSTKLQEDLEFASTKCRDFQFSGEEVDVVAQLEEAVQRFNKETAVALNICDLEALKHQLQVARELGIPDSPLLEDIKVILFECDEAQQKHIQLITAMELGDIDLIIKRQVALYDCKLAENRDSLDWKRIPGLKSPIQWAASKWIGKAELRAGFYKHTRGRIHESLTELSSSKLNSEATGCFRCILTVMGDRIASNPMFEARELLVKVHKNPCLREEVLVQLMKQLSDNPNLSSVSRGWKLFALFLRTFPTGRLEAIIFAFIRHNCMDSEALVSLMLSSVLILPTKKPSIDYVNAMFE